MTFYKVKKPYHNCLCITKSTVKKLIHNEILTYVEMRKYCIPFDWTDKIETSKRGNVNWFGHRLLPADYPLRRG